MDADPKENIKNLRYYEEPEKVVKLIYDLIKVLKHQWKYLKKRKKEDQNYMKNY